MPITVPTYILYKLTVMDWTAILLTQVLVDELDRILIDENARILTL